MTRPTINSMSPFFIVGDIAATVAFYADRLGFETTFRQPVFAILQRDGAMLFVKSGEASPLPNPKRDPEMRWDAYCYTPDPDALCQARRAVQQPAQGHLGRPARFRGH